MKIAIFNYYGISYSVGGPRGYLYNLYSGFNELGINAPDLICHKVPTEIINTGYSKNKKISDLRVFLSFIKKGICIRKEFKQEVRKYDVIHVHSTEDCFYLRTFAGYKGKLILTSHSPEPLFMERLSAFSTNIDKKYTISKILYKYVEAKSYNYANAFIFPSEGAMGIYYSFPGFSKNIKNKSVHFVMTGVPRKSVGSTCAEYRFKHDVGVNDFLISFIGRHNQIKGYDRVVKSFDTLKKNEITVFSAGALDSDIKFPNDSQWVELGYISDAADLMTASDIVVIPNRNTYYDLVIIEALSNGTIVVSSNTGGNIDISKYTSGLVLFDNNSEKDFVEKVLYIKNLTANERKIMSKNNLDFYENHGSIKIFANKYISELAIICKELK